MSRICSICGKKSFMARKLVKLRGKYNPTAKVRKYPNLQWVALPSGPSADKTKKRIKACAKCIKRMAKGK